MGLNIRINGITSPNRFKLFVKTGSTAGSDSVIATGYTQYSTGSDLPNGVFEKSTTRNYNTNPIIFTDAAYDTQYWFKLYDTVTSGYTIENITTNQAEIYDACIYCCLFTGGTADFIATPTPTPLPSPTPGPTSDCTFVNGSATVVIGPTATPVVPTATAIPPTATTIVPTPTPTPSATPTQPRLDWSLGTQSGGRLIVTDAFGNELLNQITSITPKSGTIYINESVLPYTITGLWNSGSGNTIRYRVCDISNSGELFYSGAITIMEGSVDYIVGPPNLSATPMHVSVDLRANNIEPMNCAL